MEGKNYKVSFLETLSAYNTAVSRISEIQDILEKVSTDLNNIINSEAFTGTAADNIKTYASEIHLPLIGAVSCMLVEYQSKLLLYESNYFNIDSDYATKFNAETMAQVQEQVQQYLSDNEAISTEMQTSLNSVSDIVSLPLPSKETVDFDLNWMIQKIDNLDESIVNYENLHSTDLDSLKEFIANLETFITYYHESIKPGEYRSGDCANNIYAYQLYESMQVSQEFLKNHEADIVAAGENLQKVADQMQADYDAAVQARIDQGRAEIIKGVGIAVIGGLAIIASAGAATPLVAGALCVTGTCVYGYGISNALEGVDDVYYGMKGDLSSYAFNPLRDTIFMGNQQIYDIWGQANLFAVSVLMPGSNAYSEALNAGMKGIEVTKAVSVGVAKEMVFNFAGDQATGFAVDFMDQHIGLNQTQKALSEIFIGALVDPGTYESIGNFAGNMKAKPDGPSLNDIAHESLLPDNEINFTDFMSAEDAARYNAWSSECANGTHNNFPGLKDVDIEAWKFADSQITTATAMSRIDGDALIRLQGENFRLEALNNKPNASYAEYRDLNATENLRRAGKQAGCSDKVVESYISKLEENGQYDVAKEQWGSGWNDLSREEQHILMDVVKDEEGTLDVIEASKKKGAKTLLTFKDRYNNGYFDTSNYKMDDIITRKINRNSGMKTYDGISNAEYLPKADEFISDNRVLEYTKQLFPDNENICKCTNIQELANELHDNPVNIRLVVFQDGTSGGANIEHFGGNFGDVRYSLDSGQGGVFSIPERKLSEFANNYPDICSYKDGKFSIIDFERFGEEVLSGVPMRDSGGAYMITTDVPFNGSNISMPSVNNRGSYMDYFVSGGELLSGEIEITQKPHPDLINQATFKSPNKIVGNVNGVSYVISKLE